MGAITLYRKYLINLPLVLRKQQAGFGMMDYVLRLLGSQRRVNRYRHDSTDGAGVIAEGPAGIIIGEDSQMVPPIETQGAQTRSQALNRSFNGCAIIAHPFLILFFEKQLFVGKTFYHIVKHGGNRVMIHDRLSWLSSSIVLNPGLRDQMLNENFGVAAIAANRFPRGSFISILTLIIIKIPVVKSTFIIDLPDIGPIKCQRKKNTRRITISVRPFLPIRMTLPQFYPKSLVKQALQSKSPWLRQRLDLITQQEEFLQSLPVINFPQAKQFLIERCHRLAEKHGLPFNRVAIRNQKTRWGSCSIIGNINLNIQAYRLPDHLRDYIILHELVHTLHHNHSPAFWRKLQEIHPSTPACRRELRKHPIDPRPLRT